MVTMERNPLFSWTFGHKRPRTSKKLKNRRKSLPSNDLGQIWVSVFEKRKNTDGASGRQIFSKCHKIDPCRYRHIAMLRYVNHRFYDIAGNVPRIDQNRRSQFWAVDCRDSVERSLGIDSGPPIRFSGIAAGYPFGVWVADCNQ